ncbi:hypothetical protein DF020_03610 [Burkholderia cenocepacia]|nr:hypothetical protein DF020_03610 [Burkholderia cenocepacia]
MKRRVHETMMQRANGALSSQIGLCRGRGVRRFFARAARLAARFATFGFVRCAKRAPQAMSNDPRARRGSAT